MGFKEKNTVGRVVFYEVRIVRKESMRTDFPRSSCLYICLSNVKRKQSPRYAAGKVFYWRGNALSHLNTTIIISVASTNWCAQGLMSAMRDAVAYRSHLLKTARRLSPPLWWWMVLVCYHASRYHPRRTNPLSCHFDPDQFCNIPQVYTVRNQPYVQT
jgi:hypothetical protein